jgi:hypothetical protein
MTKIKQTIIFLLLFPLTIFGQTATEIAKSGIKSTVSVVALDKILQPLGFGSGFIIDDETIVTNIHVIEGCHSAYVLLNGQEKKFSVNGYIAIDKANDLVILKVAGLFGSKLNLGNETFPEIGEKIYAVGNPKGFNGTFSEGIISGIREVGLNQILQITAPISPGSSGGPVLNSSGQIIGIAFASFSDGQNLNFAIPVKYLSALKSKITTPTSLTMVKSQPKSTTTTTIPSNIKEGVTVRNLSWGCFDNSSYNFSIKNNLPSSISDVTVLVLVYDLTGVVVDYTEDTYFEYNQQYSYSDENVIRPFLAKTIVCQTTAFRSSYKSGYKIQARILDFKIKDE